MRLFELQPGLEQYQRIRRKSWTNCEAYIIKSSMHEQPLFEIDFMSIVLKPYTPWYEDLFADDWECV